MDERQTLVNRPFPHPLVVGNWKMNGSLQSVHGLLEALVKLDYPQLEIAILPPSLFTLTALMRLNGSQVSVGAQNIHPQPYGAHTGEVSAAMFSELGCRFALAGHSERRTDQNESNAEVAAKCAAILKANMTPILCVGETFDQYRNDQTEEVIESQLNALLANLTEKNLASLVVAYEPIWAIGTGKSATPDYADRVHKRIRLWLTRQLGEEVANTVCIIYGGSVNSANARDFMVQSDIGGLLVGGASLNVSEFCKILDSASTSLLRSQEERK